MIEIPAKNIEALARAVVALRDEYEFENFRLGTSLRGPISAEEAIAKKRAINHAVYLRVKALRPDIEPRLKESDAHIVLRYDSLTAMIEPHPLLIYGRYLKYSREIPHARWYCKLCRGRGCEACGGTGRRFSRTVEELVAKPILQCSRGAASKFHSTGREDVDARMLGNGRPFVLEITKPRARSLDFARLQKEINSAYAGEIEVRELQRADREITRRVDTDTPDKSYRGVVACLSSAPREKAEALAEIDGLVLAQETPRRVLHTRANKTRCRAIRSCRVELLRSDGDRVSAFALTLRAQSGTYIKEFISGDEGRTHPSVAALLQVPCECAELDVIGVHSDPLACSSPALVQDDCAGSVCHKQAHTLHVTQ